MAPPLADLSAILDAAMQVFFRFGYKKASMDDIAKAADLSRQGLYLKFKTKDDLFKAALEHLVSRLLNDAGDISGRADIDIETQLMMIFETIHGDVGSPARTAELIDHARSRNPDIVKRFEHGFVEIVEASLTRVGVDRKWSAASLSTKDLAKHLLFAASGIKASAASNEEYKVGVAISIALVVRGEASPFPLTSRLERSIT